MIEYRRFNSKQSYYKLIPSGRVSVLTERLRPDRSYDFFMKRIWYPWALQKCKRKYPSHLWFSYFNEYKIYFIQCSRCGCEPRPNHKITHCDEIMMDKALK